MLSDISRHDSVFLYQLVDGVDFKIMLMRTIYQILPKLGALLSVRSVRTRAVTNDHRAKNFLDLLSKDVLLLSSDPC